MAAANVMLLIAVFLPPKALDCLGSVVEERTVHTPYGDIGPLALRVANDGVAVWVEPYAGLPSRTDPRATVQAAAQLGVQRIIVWDHAVAVNPVLERGWATIAADLIDWTRHQPATFYADPHVTVDPDQFTGRPMFCPELNAALHHLLPGAPSVIYLGVDGPRRETPAEARMAARWGADVLGQNLLPEVALAQELGLCFAGIVTITDYSSDQSRPSIEGAVRHGLERTLAAVPELVRHANEPRQCMCGA